MSWVVEQSGDTSAVNVHGDTITCTKDGYYGSPINVLYKDPANQNGQYFWQIQFQDIQESGAVSVGLTTDQGFRDGWGLKAMKYLGNLSDGSALLVSSFGDHIKENDKIGILLQISGADLKVYIFHNDQPLGLAFHIQSPYPKPLYPVVSFNTNAKAKIARLQAIPKPLERAPLEFAGIEGNWKIMDYPQHPECIGCEFEIASQDQNTYRLHARVVNSLNCNLQYNPSNNQCKISPIMSTMMAGPPEEMNKEALISSLISGIKSLTVQGQQQLIIQTNNVGQARLERYAVAAPSPVTENIFN